MPNTQAAVERALRRKAELKYNQALRRITRELQSRIDGLTDPLLIISELRRAAESKGFLELCRLAAERIATVVAIGEKTNWRQAATASTKGKAVYSALRKGTAPDTAIGQAIREIVERNAELIRTVPQETARQLSQMAKEAQFKGMRPAELAELIQQKAPHLNNSQAKLIARTESAKASTALQQARAESLKPIRSLGVRGADLVTDHGNVQLSLFEDELGRVHLEHLEKAIDDLRRRYGYFCIQRGMMLQDRRLGNLDAKSDHVIHPVSYVRG